MNSRTAFQLACDCLFWELFLAFFRLFLAFFRITRPPFTLYLDFSVILKKLEADVVIIMLLDTSLGKELTNWDRLLSKNVHHSSQLASWVLKWGVWRLFLSLRFSILISMVLCLVLIFLVSLDLRVRLFIPGSKINDTFARVVRIWWLLVRTILCTKNEAFH